MVIKKKYDYVILGAGMGGLSIGALLAKKGHSVCIVEANSKVGGHAYTFSKGPYKFCHDVQYLMGCQKGGPIHILLQKLGLDNKIKFNKLNPKCYDLISIKNKRVEIPSGIDNYKRELMNLYPKYAIKIDSYFEREKKIYAQTKGEKKVLTSWDIIKAPWNYLTLIRYMNYTLEDSFRKYKFPKELRAILAGRIGNLSASPREASYIMYSSMDVAYCQSAYFPAKGMDYFISQITKVITKNKKCKILLDTKVTKIKAKEEKIESVTTTKGVVRGKNFISNMDPKKTFSILEGVKVPGRYGTKLKYKYSDSVFCIYLGLRLDLKKKKFKRRNIWHHSTFNFNEEYSSEIKNNDFSHPWLFISTPSLLADEGVMSPKGKSTMEILTFVNYDYFKSLKKKSTKKYEKVVEEISNEIINIVSKNYFPKLKDYIEVKVVHTPVDMERILLAPKGNVYGSRITPKNYNLNRLTLTTPIPNLYLVGASASFPGIMGVTVGALDLFERIEG